MNLDNIIVAILLVGFLVLMMRINRLSAAIDKLTGTGNKASGEPTNQVSEEISYGAPNKQIGEELNPEIIAAIAAALVAYEQDGKKLVVRSIRKATGNTPIWSQTGRLDQLSSRL